MPLEIEQRGKHSYWITNLPDGDPDCGSYDTRAEADDDRRGLERFFKHGHKRGYVTSDKPLSQTN